MKIAGIYPFEAANDTKVQNLYGEPIGLELVLASAKKAGHEARLFLPVKNNLRESKSVDELVGEVIEFEPDVAAFSLYTCQFDFGKEIAEELKRKRPGIKIVAGNRHPTTNARELEQPFDFYVLGEGEQSFVELLHEMGNGGDYKEVRGIAFRQGSELVVTQPRPFIEELDCIPNAMRSSCLLKQGYAGLGFPPAGKKPTVAIVEYSRGCRGFCKFCDNTLLWKRQVRFRSAKKTVDEMAALKKRGVEMFYFMDLNFTSSKEKALEFCDEIASRKEEFGWYCMSNIDTATPKLLGRLKEAGCFKVNYGVESTSDESLRHMKKGLVGKKTLEMKSCLRVLKKTQKTGLMAGGYYIIGFPWENRESILEDAKKLKDYAIHCLNVGIATPHPGTAWRHEFNESELINNWKNYDRKHLCYRHSSLDEKTLQGLQKKICADFYQSREYISNVRELVAIEPRFRQSFEDYFKIAGIKQEVQECKSMEKMRL